MSQRRNCRWRTSPALLVLEKNRVVHIIAPMRVIIRTFELAVRHTGGDCRLVS